MTSRAHVVINPIAGTGRGPGTPEAQAALARAVLARAGYLTTVTITGGPHDAFEASTAAVAAGARVVVAWGGDGTVNEVGRALIGRDTALGIVPRGSGNGLARELGIPLDPDRALEVVARGALRRLDVGELGGAPFFNLAGIGLDARVARAFAENRGRRGFLRYLQIGVRELWHYRAALYRIEAGEAFESRALMVVVANARQYGNGACIAPLARPDDGRLDLVVVEAQALWRTLVRLPAFFTGTLRPGPGLLMRQVERLTIDAGGPTEFHVDGEPRRSDGPLRARILPGALLVRVPRS